MGFHSPLIRPYLLDQQFLVGTSFKKTYHAKDIWVPSRGQIQSPDEPRKKPSYFPLYWLFNRDPIIIPI